MMQLDLASACHRVGLYMLAGVPRGLLLPLLGMYCVLGTDFHKWMLSPLSGTLHTNVLAAGQHMGSCP
jgi:hypothetical protein